MDRSFQLLAAGEAAATDEAWSLEGWTKAGTSSFRFGPTQWKAGEGIRVAILEAVEEARERAELSEVRVTVSSDQAWLQSIALMLAEQTKMRSELRRLQLRLQELENRSDGTGTAEDAGLSRSVTWRETHADDFRAYAGRYVAWGAQGIVASADDYSALLAKLSKLGNPRGLGIEYVPKGPRVRR